MGGDCGAGHDGFVEDGEAEDAGGLADAAEVIRNNAELKHRPHIRNLHLPLISSAILTQSSPIGAT